MLTVEFRGWRPRITRDRLTEPESAPTIEPETYIRRSNSPSWQQPPSWKETALWIVIPTFALVIELGAISTLPTPGTSKNIVSRLGIFDSAITK